MLRSSLRMVFLYSLTATFDGYIPWTTDVHTYSIDDFLQVRKGQSVYILTRCNKSVKYRSFVRQCLIDLFVNVLWFHCDALLLYYLLYKCTTYSVSTYVCTCTYNVCSLYITSLITTFFAARQEISNRRCIFFSF